MVKYLKACTILFFILSAFTVIAQKQTKLSKPDSLAGILGSTKSYPKKISVLNDLCKYYINVNPVKATGYADKGLQLAQQAGVDSDKSRFYGFKGESYLFKGDYNNALKQLKIGYSVADKYHMKKQMVVSLTDIGAVYETQGNFSLSLQYFFKSLQGAELLKNPRLITASNVNIGVVYLNQRDFEKCRVYVNKALAICKTNSFPTLECKAYEFLGSAYNQEGKYPEARANYFRALKIDEDTKNDFGAATIYTLLQPTYGKNYAKQLELGLKAQVLWDKIGPENIYAIGNLGGIGNIYADMARDTANGKGGAANSRKLLQKAETYLMKAVELAKKTNSQPNIMELSDSLSVVSANLGKYQNAYLNLRTRNAVYDSVFSQENKNKIASIEGKHEIELRDKQLKINQLEIADQHKQKWFLVGGLLTLVVIAGLIYYQNHQRKKTNNLLIILNNELDEANKVKTRFFNILNHDLRSPVANFVTFLQIQEEPGLLDEKQRAGYAKKATLLAENLLNNMEDLLLWSKGQMENFKPSIKIIKVERLFEYLQSAASTPENIQLGFEQQPGMELKTDEHYIKTIIYNLTNNAIKALGIKAGGSINWKAWEKENKKYLSITDNGPGATQEAFRALYDDSAPIGIKNGLGLHIVRDLAKAIGCKVTVTSNPGLGAEITIEFN
jgi:signal transduction histidine kinase